ncbi:hypothetical protein KM043_011442 [Ampulex compressa]|nr:hypothetical protein KM043_011442 [Ampulex compressa]
MELKHQNPGIALRQRRTRSAAKCPRLSKRDEDEAIGTAMANSPVIVLRRGRSVVVARNEEDGDNNDEGDLPRLGMPPDGLVIRVLEKSMLDLKEDAENSSEAVCTVKRELNGIAV